MTAAEMWSELQDHIDLRELINNGAEDFDALPPEEFQYRDPR